jgi:formylglycine-generating enzyme required for sulfatase activity
MKTFNFLMLLTIICLLLLSIGAPNRCNPPEPKDMVAVPAGNFYRGSCNEETSPSCNPGKPGYASFYDPDYAAPDESPLREIFISDFTLDIYEITNAQYSQFLNESGIDHALGCGDNKPCINTDDEDFESHITYDGNSYAVERGYDDHPMLEVTWYGAKKYCEYYGKRLPTEAEWEKAARGTKGWKFPWGNDAPNSKTANYDTGDTTPVGSYPEDVSPYGAYDMGGNLMEWVNDLYAYDYYSNSPDQDPTGPVVGYARVAKGGSWYFNADYMRCAKRPNGNPGGANSSTGFRCVRDRE